MAFEIDQIILRIVKLPAVEAFVTSGWTTTGKTPIIVEVQGNGISGWGESAVPLFPFYNHETPKTALHILQEFAIPLFFKERPENPQAAFSVLKKIIGNPFARAGLEMAYWDWFAKSKGEPLYKTIGGIRNTISVGVSVGIQKSEGDLLKRVSEFLDHGYQRIKIKIAPGNELKLIETLMNEFPNLPLMVDANSAYNYSHAEIFRSMDRFNLLMIEQPFRDGDLLCHAKLQREIKNSICLDESITCLEDAQAALEMESCKVINIKPGRVAGLSEAVRIHDYCLAHKIPVWCGGMLETGIGRAANMALATLPGFLMPGDISESKRYYHEDIVQPEITLGPKGTLTLLDTPGIGFEVNREALARFTLNEYVIHKTK